MLKSCITKLQKLMILFNFLVSDLIKMNLTSLLVLFIVSLTLVNAAKLSDEEYSDDDYYYENDNDSDKDRDSGENCNYFL